MPTLFCDPQSPYAYLAFARAAAVLGVEPELRIVTLGPIFARRGFGSWARTDRREEGLREVERRAARYGLAGVRWPDGWPLDSLVPARAATWAAAQGAGPPFLAALFARTFAHGDDPSDLDVVRTAAAAAGLDPGEVEPGVGAEATKRTLRETTDAAWELGVRGIPTTEVDGMLFFGDDRLEDAAAALAARRGTA